MLPKPLHDRQMLDRAPVRARCCDQKSVAVLCPQQGKIVRRQQGREREIDEIVAVALAPERHHEIERAHVNAFNHKLGSRARLWPTKPRPSSRTPSNTRIANLRNT